MNCCMKHKCNSVRWIHTSKCSFSEVFFPVLIWGQFLFHHRPECAPKYHFAEHKVKESANYSKQWMVELCVMCHTPESNLSVSFSVVIMWGHFLFHHGTLWAPKSHFEDSTNRVLANCFPRLSYNSVRGIHRSQRSFPESIIHVLNWWYFLYQRRPQCDPR